MAEVGPVEKSKRTIEKRLDDLERRGVLARPDAPRKPLKPVARRDGALERFLRDRGR